LWLIGALLIGGALGYWRYVSVGPGIHSIGLWAEQTPMLIGTIAEYSGDVKRQKLTLKDLSINDQLVDDRLLAFVPGYPKLKTGQIVQINCKLETPEAFEGFRYDRYLASQDIYATCFSREVPLVLDQSSDFVILDRIHEQARSAIQRVFGEPQATLLAGLLMGDNDFSESWKDRFLRTGTSHVVAASGYNVSMLALVLFAILIRLGFWRQQAYPLVLLGIAAFVVLAGAGAAVTRAGIMGALALTAVQVGRKTTPRNIILLTVVIMLLAEPRLLRDDVGFQLSVLSTIGLVTMSKYWSEKFVFIPETFGLRESFAATIAATLATLPVIIFGFGRFSVISPIVNLLILPFVPYAMLVGGIAAIVGIFSQALGAVLAGPAWLFLTAMQEIIKAMAELPFAVLSL
jgi:competence protein ComEC